MERRVLKRVSVGSASEWANSTSKIVMNESEVYSGAYTVYE